MDSKEALNSLRRKLVFEKYTSKSKETHEEAHTSEKVLSESEQGICESYEFSEVLKTINYTTGAYHRQKKIARPEAVLILSLIHI